MNRFSLSLSPAAAVDTIKDITSKIPAGLIDSLVLLLSIPGSLILACYLAVRLIREPKYGLRFRERLGALPGSWKATRPGGIWLHAVSVGEVIGAASLVKELKQRAPSRPVFVSVTTLAGRLIADQRLRGLADGVFFAPLDFRWIVRRVLRVIRPSVVVILETEIWPSLFREVKRCGCGLMIVNGRISDRALPRYERFRGLFRSILEKADAILVQSEQDRERFLAIGAPADRTRVSGNLKFDFTLPDAAPAPIEEFLGRVRPRRIWIASSTMPPRDSVDIDEHDAVIAAFKQVARPGLLLILAPRRPDTFGEVSDKLKRAGVPYVRRSKLDVMSRLQLPGVLLLDSIGELASLFPKATVVFMGGTLAARGGHNILEPALAAKPVICGPNMQNFAAIDDAFAKAGALVRIKSPAELGAAVSALLDDPERARGLGQSARALAEAQGGATRRAADQVDWLQQAHWPLPVPTLTSRLLLGPLTWIWRAGSARKRNAAVPRQLPIPVVSVGGLAMGGSGKTPLVAHVARRLKQQGWQPAILTRGYGRRSPVRQVVLPAGQTAPVSLTGDEVQIYLNDGQAHIGIGADRYDTGQLLLSQLRADCALLDDGFQHYSLARDLDIVLLDGLDPFAGGLFPLGRLREVPECLERAQAIVLTRVGLDQDTSALENLIRRYTAAPLFRCAVQPIEWVDARSDETRPPDQLGLQPLLAFCGLGNPASFRLTLEELHLPVACFTAFDDHHRYTPYELRNLLAQARHHHAVAMVTTQKDRSNLPAEFPEVLGDLPLWWLRIGVRFDREEELMDLIRGAIAARGQRIRQQD